MTIKVTGIRVATGAREELNEFAEQAWRDGTTSEVFTDIREEPPADASLEARAKYAATVYDSCGNDATDSSDEQAWLAVVRAVDASYPRRRVDEFTPAERIELAAKVKAAVERERLDASRPGLTEEPHEIADAAEKLLESLGEYVRQSMHANREWSEGIRAIEAALLARKKRLFHASSGETGPDDQTVCMAAPAKAGWAFDRETGRWTGPSPSDPAIAVEMRQWEADVDAAERAKLSRGETGALPGGLTSIMHAAQQRPSVPPDLGPGIGGAPIHVRPTGAPAAAIKRTTITHTVDLGCARPIHVGPEATCTLCHPAPDPRATLHAGDPASLADVVAASAREPHADVVLQALHVSGGAAAIGVESPVRPLPSDLLAQYAAKRAPNPLTDEEHAAFLAGVTAGRYGRSADDFTPAEREALKQKARETLDAMKAETCGAICPPGLVAQGRACKEPKGHAPPHCADVAEGSGSCWFPGYTGAAPREP